MSFSLRSLTLSYLIFLLFFTFSCDNPKSGNSLSLGTGVEGPAAAGEPSTFRGAGIIQDNSFLIDGPLAQGATGDILLQNDMIRVIIQKPTRNSGVGLFGGNIIDADLTRAAGQAGQDQFGIFFPLVNLSYTVNYQKLEILNGDFANGPVVVQATGILDVYDYIQTNIIVPFAQIFNLVNLFFSPRFDDSLDPFQNVPELRGLSPVIVTQYTLAQDSSYVMIETQFYNRGEVELKMPVGDWVNGSGTLEPFVPRLGFIRAALVEPIGALIYQGMEDNVGVSYGYFFNPVQFINEDGSIRPSTSLSVSGVTPVVLGESLLSILPSGGESSLKINFSIPPKSTRTITRYFVVGNGDVASVANVGFEAVGISKLRFTGKVTDTTGNPVIRARVAVLDSTNPDNPNPITVGFSDAAGNFTMDVSAGTDVKDQIFGAGTYIVQIYKEGYSLAGSNRAGKCSGGSLDATTKTVSGIQCQLGASGTVTVNATEAGAPIPARVTIVGFDPSPTHPYAITTSDRFGRFADINLLERPYGIVDLLYLDHTGKLAPYAHPRIIQSNQFRLEPGTYEIYVTRGPEYSVYHQRVTVSPNGSAVVNAALTKVLDTTGYVCADLHLHGIKSADSAFGLESRTLGALAEGMDILVSTDHDYITDYGPAIQKLGAGGLITSIPGDEITPLAFGHMLAFPLAQDPNHPTGGAYDYTYTATDNPPGPGHDMVQTLSEIIQGVDVAHPGTQVFQMAHILDKATGNFAISGLVTSPSFQGVSPLSTYADPVKFRMPANTNSAGGFSAPFPLGTSGMFSLDFTSVELTIGAYKDTLDHLVQTSLPVYFNLLNLGALKTATSSSDSHTQVREPIGTPRNYILSSVDPRDGVGGAFSAIDHEEIANNVNNHRVIVSNGVFIKVKVSSASNPQGVTVGDMISGSGDVTLDLEITSNEYFDWDRVEIYANTIPTPAKDDMSGVTDLSAANFHSSVYRQADGALVVRDQKYLISPLFQFAKGVTGEGALEQTVSNGIRKATMSHDFHFTEDTWIVVLVRGSNGVRSLFPYVTKEANVNITPENFLNTLTSNPAQIGGIRAFGFTNPIFVDVDGNGFEAKWIREGKSPLVNQATN